MALLFFSENYLEIICRHVCYSKPLIYINCKQLNAVTDQVPEHEEKSLTCIPSGHVFVIFSKELLDIHEVRKSQTEVKRPEMQKRRKRAPVKASQVAQW